MQKVSRWYFAAMAAVIFIVTVIILWSLQLPVQERDVWRIQPRFKFPHGSQKRSLASQSVNVHFAFDGREIDLDLAENELLMSHPPVFIAEKNGSITRLNIDDEGTEKPMYMQDRKGRAAVALTANFNQQYGPAYEIDGIIFYGSETYQITPIRNATPETNMEVEFSHELRRISLPAITDHVLGTDMKKSSKEIQQNFFHGSPRVRRSPLPVYEVQLLYVIDNSIYRKTRSSLLKRRLPATRFDVVKSIQFYFLRMTNLVDMRYRSITTAPFTIRTKLTSLYTATSVIESRWTEIPKVGCSALKQRTGRRTVRSDMVLESLADTLHGESGAEFRANFPRFDHATLFTKYDLCVSDEERILGGLAYIKSICTNASVSIVKHMTLVHDAIVSAHELGHSLGALHDGENNSCVSSSENIMMARDNISKNASPSRFTFSNCSVNYFTDTILSLEDNCLTDAEEHHYATDWQSKQDALIGEAFSPDKRCSQFAGHSFRACGGTEYGRKICSELWCYNMSAPVSTSVNCVLSNTTVLDRTACGNKRWCRKGKCVKNFLAPEAFDDCPVGNLADNFQVRSDYPFVCWNMPTYFCYDKDTYRDCCGSCNSLRDHTRPGCEYGEGEFDDNCNSTIL